jgi:DNA polymerase III epsilon subunit-like protein
LPEYAALDLETTGLDPARDRVIEIGAVAFTSEQVTSTLEQLVDPGRAVPDTVPGSTSSSSPRPDCGMNRRTSSTR